MWNKSNLDLNFIEFFSAADQNRWTYNKIKNYSLNHIYLFTPMKV